MPYVTANDYARVRHLIDPSSDVPMAGGVGAVEAAIYDLNRRIKAEQDTATAEDWLMLLRRHVALVASYRRGGGRSPAIRSSHD